MNEVITKPLDSLETNYQPPTFKQPLPIASLPAANLPYPILDAVRHAFPTAHFVAVAPNCSGSCLVTTESVADIPLGYVVVLVFDHVHGEALPATHQDGTVYIVPGHTGGIIPPAKT